MCMFPINYRYVSVAVKIQIFFPSKKEGLIKLKTNIGTAANKDSFGTHWRKMANLCVDEKNMYARELYVYRFLFTIPINRILIKQTNMLSFLSLTRSSCKKF